MSLHFVLYFCAKLNATNVLTTLNEESEINDFSGGDSDFDTRCQPLLKKIAGQSDLSLDQILTKILYIYQ